MPNPLPHLFEKHVGPQFLPRLRQKIIGVAQDFWADGSENLLKLDFKPKSGSKDAKIIHMPSQKHHDTQPAVRDANVWHAEPGEISEKMWGEGFVAPGGNLINGMLTKPLSITNEMSILDLSTGLGGFMRRTVEETGAYFTGLEPDPDIAKRGMQMSVKAGESKHAPVTGYDPGNLSLNRHYDCVLARETFYRLPDYATFFATIEKHTKPGAQLAFTDYIVEAESRQNPAILAWFNNEKLAKPLAMSETMQAWEKVDFKLRVHEDLSDFYKAEVIVGLKRLMEFLASGIQPDKETALAVLRRIETWKYRLAAMDAGMKFYRFYGAKK